MKLLKPLEKVVGSIFGSKMVKFKLKKKIHFINKRNILTFHYQLIIMSNGHKMVKVLEQFLQIRLLTILNGLREIFDEKKMRISIVGWLSRFSILNWHQRVVKVLERFLRVPN